MTKRIAKEDLELEELVFGIKTSKYNLNVISECFGIMLFLLLVVCGMVFESRLAGWLSKNFPETFKVLVKCKESVAAERISSRDGVDGERAMKEGALREGMLKDKFIRLYDAGDYLDEENFDLVIDTAKVGADEAMQLVLDKVNQTSG